MSQFPQKPDAFKTFLQFGCPNHTCNFKAELEQYVCRTKDVSKGH